MVAPAAIAFLGGEVKEDVVILTTMNSARNLPNYMPPNGRIYLITGPNTFSAGLIAAARLKHFAGDKIVVVGKPAGDELQFRAEGFLIKLPVTGIRAYVSTARHDF